MPKQREAVVILDYGSQYTQLIARRVRELKVYSEIFPWNTPRTQVMALRPAGFILSGSPNSVYDPGAPSLPPYVLQVGVPVLGLCYGMQLLAYSLDGTVVRSGAREYGPATAAIIDPQSPLLSGLPPTLEVWMSHGDRVERVPSGFHLLAQSDNTPHAAMSDDDRRWYGIQFHPEVQHTPQGIEILRRFLYDICGCAGTWTAGQFIEEATARIRAQVGDSIVVCGLSGGVDSAVTQR